MARVSIAVGVIGSSARAALWLALGALTLGAAVATRQVFAQAAAGDQVTLLSADKLAELVGPIALYPDDLVAIVLPASTYPLQVVQAARFLDDRAKNPGLQPNADWDDSVVALLNYPEVVKLMNDDLDWTWRLGDAVIGQNADVLDAIQGFRDRAYAAGNLRSDDRQVVVNDDEGAIAIKPADPEVIYVPYYEPERVVIYQPAPVYHYYPFAYPVYYYPYPVGYAFHTGYFWGVTSAFVIGWNTHFLYVHHHDYWGHPYYGRSYYDPFYVRRDVNVSVSRGGYVWEPHYRRGAQPFTRSDGRRFTGTRDERSAGAQGSYRNGDGAVSRSGGQQRQQPADPRAAATRDRATPGTTPRLGGVGGTYRSGAAASGAEQRSRGAGAPGGQRADGTNGTAPSTRQTNPPVRNREASQPYRSAPQTSPPPQTREQARETAPPRAGEVRETPTPRTGGPAAARAPGQYRSGSGMSQGLRQPPQAPAEQGRAQVGRPDNGRALGAQREGQYRSGGSPQRYAAPQPQNTAPTVRVAPPQPTVRVAPPQAERSGEPRTFAGIAGGNPNRAERPAPPPEARAAPPREQRDDGGSSGRPDYSRGDGGGRSAPAYRGGDEGRSGGGRNPNQSVRGGRATER